jgi:uncharacterized membrane protein YphA (DoxX/SURF4 family)
MNVALWILQILLAVAFLGAGATKLLKPKEQLGEKMGWAEDFSQPMIKFIGAAEVLGALGLILPAVTGIVPVLTPIAAVGLVLVMVGAAIAHVRRKEYPAGVIAPIVLGALALFVAVERFGPYHL